jgi:hypothetical protein
MFSILDNFALPADEILLELKPLMKSMKKKQFVYVFTCYLYHLKLINFIFRIYSLENGPLSSTISI